MALFQTGDSTEDAIAQVTLAINNSNWFKRAFIEAVRLLTVESNWAEQYTITPEEAANLASQAFDTIRFGGNMIGAIIPFAMSALPDYVLECDGSLYLKADYPELAALISDEWQADETQFFVPDLRGKFIQGIEGADYSGKFVGSQEMTLAIENMPQHAHTYSAAAPGIELTDVGVPTAAASYAGVLETSYVGGSTAFDNRPRSMTLTYGIVYK